MLRRIIFIGVITLPGDTDITVKLADSPQFMQPADTVP
jgi:hypothetical protein